MLHILYVSHAATEAFGILSAFIETRGDVASVLPQMASPAAIAYTWQDSPWLPCLLAAIAALLSGTAHERQPQPAESAVR